MLFEDFLDLMSVFSDRCPSQIKAYYAFHIYDFDEDGVISKADIAEMVKRLTGVDDEQYFRKQNKLKKQKQEQNRKFQHQNPNFHNQNGQDQIVALDEIITSQPHNSARRQGVASQQKGQVKYDQYKNDNAYYKQNEMNDPLKFIDEIANAILKEAGDQDSLGANSSRVAGISQVEFQKILLQNTEFKNHFTFKIV